MAASSYKEIVLTLHPINCHDSVGRRRIILNKANQKVLVGRGSKNTAKDLVPAESNAYFDSPVMSRRHAIIELDDNEFITLTDVGSMHGTYIDGGSRMEMDSPSAISQGQIVKFGSEVYRGAERFPPKTFSIGIDRRMVSQPTQTTIRNGYGLTSEDLILDDAPSDEDEEEMYDSPAEREWEYSPAPESHSSPPPEVPTSSVREVLEDDVPAESSKVVECNVEQVDISFESSKSQDSIRKTSRVAIQDLMNGESDVDNDEVPGTSSNKPLVIDESEGEGEISVSRATLLNKRKVEIVDITSDDDEELEDEDDNDDEQEEEEEYEEDPNEMKIEDAKTELFLSIELNTPPLEKESEDSGSTTVAEVTMVQETIIETDSDQAAYHTPSPKQSSTSVFMAKDTSATKNDSTIASGVIADLAASSKPGTDLTLKAASIRERAQEFFKSRDEVENTWNSDGKKDNEKSNEPFIPVPNWLKSYYKSKDVSKPKEKSPELRDESDDDEDEEGENNKEENKVFNTFEEDVSAASDAGVSQWSGKRQPSMVNSASVVDESDEDEMGSVDYSDEELEDQENSVASEDDEDSEMESSHCSSEDEEDEEEEEEDGEHSEDEDIELEEDAEEENEDSMDEDAEGESDEESAMVQEKHSYIATAQPPLANISAPATQYHSAPTDIPFGILPYPTATYAPAVWDTPAQVMPENNQPVPIEPQPGCCDIFGAPTRAPEFSLPYVRAVENHLPYDIAQFNNVVPGPSTSHHQPPPPPMPMPVSAAIPQVEPPKQAIVEVIPEAPKSTPKKRTYDTFVEDDTPTRTNATATADPKATLHDELGAMDISGGDEDAGAGTEKDPLDLDADAESTPKKAKGNTGKAIARYAGTAIAGAFVGGMAMFAALVATATE